MNEKRSQSLNSFPCSHKKYRSLVMSLCVIFVVKIWNGMRMTRRAHKGQSIKYVTLFLANFDPLLLSHFVTHPETPQRYVTHLGPPFLVQKTRTKTLCTNSLSIVREVFSRGLLSGRVCSGWFLSVPLLSEYICYNRKLNITLNFRLNMYDKKKL